MTGTTYRYTKASGKDYTRKYRIDYERQIVQYTVNNGVSWHKSMFTVADLKHHIANKHMVEVALV